MSQAIGLPLLMLSSFIRYFFNKIVLLSSTWMVSCFSLYHAYRQVSCKLFIWLWLMLIPQNHYQNHHYCLSMIQRWRYSLKCGRQTALFLTGCKYSQRWKVLFKNSRVFLGINFRCDFLRVESNLIQCFIIHALNRHYNKMKKLRFVGYKHTSFNFCYFHHFEKSMHIQPNLPMWSPLLSSHLY